MLTWSIKRNELVRRSSNNETPLTAVLYSMLYNQIRCIALRVLQTSKGFWVFLFRQSFEWGRGKCKSQRNALAHASFAHASFALKNKTENSSRLIENSEGNSDGEWYFCKGEGDRLCFILASKEDICKKDQKHVRAKLVNYCPRQDDHQQWTLKHRNKQNGSKSTNHKSQTMAFWTRSSTHLFPKRVAQRIWQLYRRKKVKCQVPIVLKHLASTYVPTFP